MTEAMSLATLEWYGFAAGKYVTQHDTFGSAEEMWDQVNRIIAEKRDSCGGFGICFIIRNKFDGRIRIGVHDLGCLFMMVNADSEQFVDGDCFDSDEPIGFLIPDHTEFRRRILHSWPTIIDRVNRWLLTGALDLRFAPMPQ